MPKPHATRLAVILAGLAVATAALGPRPDRDTSWDPIRLPPDPDGYVAQAEARFTDITPGAEKRIEWVDSSARAPTDLAVVYLHGYSATRQEVRPLVETLASHLGANAFMTRLTGHGRTQEAMAEASLSDWTEDVAEALAVGRQLGKKVVLVGTSTGATLAAWAAAQEDWDDHLAALVLMSPNFRPADPSAAVLGWPWGGLIARLVVGPYREWQPENELQARYWTTRYPTEALLPMAALVAEARDLDLSRIEAPTLVLYSRDDRVVSVAAIESRSAGIPNEQLVDLGPVGDPSNHVLAGTILSPDDTARVLEMILQFLDDSL